jgi:hypothetical protein
MIKMIFYYQQLYILHYAQPLIIGHGMEDQITDIHAHFSGFCCGAHEIFALLECQAAMIGISLLTFWDRLDL